MQKNKLILENILSKSRHTLITLSEILDLHPEELSQQETEQSQKKLTALVDFIEEYALEEYTHDSSNSEENSTNPQSQE